MDVSSHFMFSILTVSQFAENRKASESVLLTLMVPAQRGSLFESPAHLPFTLGLTAVQILSGSPSLSSSISHLTYLNMAVNQCDVHSHFALEKKIWSLLSSTIQTCLSPCIHWSVPGQDAESLTAYTVADPDLWLLQMRANEKTNSPHAVNPFAGRIWLDCSFKSESCYVSGSTSSPVFLPSLCTCWRWGRRTSLAPACFASVTIYQATIKAEGSPLAPRSRCVCAAARSRGHDMNAALTLG